MDNSNLSFSVLSDNMNFTDILYIFWCVFFLDKIYHRDTLSLLFPEHGSYTLPNYNNLEWSKLKPFADDKINVGSKIRSLFIGCWKISWEKEEMLISSIFSFFPQCFQKGSFEGSLKVEVVW